MTDACLTEYRDRIRRGGDPALYQEIERLLAGRREQVGGHLEWALLCEEAGLLNLAFREFQLAVRDEPGNPTAGFRLAQHYRERGNAARALDLFEALLAREPAREEWLVAYLDLLAEEGALPRARQAVRRAQAAGLPAERVAALEGRLTPGEEEADDPGEELAFVDADLIRFQGLFAGREDVHARQWAQPGGETGYSPVKEPLTPAVVRNHLLGTYTVGVYPIRLDGTCTFFAVDLDVDRAALEQARSQPALARQLRADLRAEGLRLLRVLQELGLPVLFEDSGYKGRHYWVFLAEPEAAPVLHQLGRLLLGWQARQLPRGLHLEFFPKQAAVQGKGLGNLIKLPLGIHRRTGRRALLLDDGGQPLPRPMEALRRVERLARERLYAVCERLKGLAVATGADPAPAERAAPGEPAGPPPPAPPPGWTDADFQADPRMRHLLECCPVLAELKRTVEQHRRLGHEEQLVVIHTLGHLDGGPQAVNHLLGRCVDVGPEKLLKGQLRGNPVSCPSIRKKIGHVTRRVKCNCSFGFAPDRYPTPLLHLLTLPAEVKAEPSPVRKADLATLAQRYAALEQRRREIDQEFRDLQQVLVQALRAAPERAAVCPGGRYRLIEADGVEELRWEADAPADRAAQAS